MALSKPYRHAPAPCRRHRAGTHSPTQLLDRPRHILFPRDPLPIIPLRFARRNAHFRRSYRAVSDRPDGSDRHWQPPPDQRVGTQQPGAHESGPAPRHPSMLRDTGPCADQPARTAGALAQTMVPNLTGHVSGAFTRHFTHVKHIRMLGLCLVAAFALCAAAAGPALAKAPNLHKEFKVFAYCPSMPPKWRQKTIPPKPAYGRGHRTTKNRPPPQINANCGKNTGKQIRKPTKSFRPAT